MSEEKFGKEVIKGFPELHWTGKHSFSSQEYYPAQLRETYGQAKEGWINKIFWGDNLQVMGHLMKEFQGKVDLIYIDPPFDSKADYKKKIEIRGVGKAESDSSSFEEKQYGDIWTSDEYLQFMYERLIMCSYLLSDTGSIYLHCDWHKSHYLRILMDSVFGPSNFRNEIIWCYRTSLRSSTRTFGHDHDTILFYAFNRHTIHPDRKDFPVSEATIKRWASYADENGFVSNKNFAGSASTIIDTSDESKGFYINQGIPRDWWEISSNVAKGNTDEVIAGKYPTQKPETLLERIIKASSNPGDLVFDCFMGSGTTQAVAMKLGRRFIGADINLGAIQTTTKRLISVGQELDSKIDNEIKYTGFEVYNVNNYDFFRNPIEAREILISALEIQPFDRNNIWDGELDGRMVKILPVNHIATIVDLKDLIANLPYKVYEQRKSEHPTQPVEKITFVCMGHQPDLELAFKKELAYYKIDKIDVQIVDILKDKKNLQLKREAEAEVAREGSKLIIRQFYPLNLMQKLSLEKDNFVEDWRQLVDSVMIDWNYDGAVLQPEVIDVPEKGELVAGIYDIPANTGKIRVKITDVLSESIEKEV